MTDSTHRHHDDLENNQVRDLLAEELMDFRVGNGVTGDRVLRDLLLREIERTTAALEAFDKGVGFGLILRQFGWREHDVSDDVSYNSETYRCFIGTDKEREELYPTKKD